MTSAFLVITPSFFPTLFLSTTLDCDQTPSFLVSACIRIYMVWVLFSKSSAIGSLSTVATIHGPLLAISTGEVPKFKSTSNFSSTSVVSSIGIPIFHYHWAMVAHEQLSFTTVTCHLPWLPLESGHSASTEGCRNEAYRLTSNCAIAELLMACFSEKYTAQIWYLVFCGDHATRPMVMPARLDYVP